MNTLSKMNISRFVAVYISLISTLVAISSCKPKIEIVIPSPVISVAPDQVSATAGNTQNTLTWEGSSDAVTYNIYWSNTTGVTKLNGTKITSASSPYVHTSLINETAYYYVATAVNTAGESADSAQVGVVPTANPNTWTAKLSMPVTRFANSIAGIVNLLYAVGGTNYGCSPYATLEVYDPATNAWTAKTSMPTPRWSLSSGVVSGTLYAIGGTDGCYTPATGMTTVEAYDPISDTWSTKAPMPTARADHGIGVINKTLYVIGGFSSATPINTVDAYNSETNTWTSVASMTVARTTPGVAVINNILYAVGGYDGATVLNSVEAYNPITNLWTSVASMPTARTSLAVGVINGILYAAGGHNGVSVVNSVEAYNPTTNTWATVTSMTTARTAPSAGVVNNIFYVVGGISSGGGPVSIVEAYAP